VFNWLDPYSQFVGVSLLVNVLLVLSLFVAFQCGVLSLASVGFAADGRARHVIGIDASCTPDQTKAQVLDIAQSTAALVGAKDITADDIVLKEDYAYPVYGVPSKETIEAIRLSARLEGMITDPVYEGKSMQGMIDLVQKGFFPKGSKVLYAHLGGAPALNGYSYTFRNG